MARYLGPRLKLSRREGTDLFLTSGTRPIDSKCKLEQPPGQHGARRGRLSDYAVQLREKQKVRRLYGVLEKQFRNYYKKADRQKAQRAKTCCVCWKAVWTMWSTAWASAPRALSPVSLCRTRRSWLTAFKSTLPRIRCERKTSSGVTEAARNQLRVQAALQLAAQRAPIEWVDVDPNKFEGVFKRTPDREELPQEINENLIVELYSK